MPPRPGTGDHIGRVDFPAIYADAFGEDSAASAAFYEMVKSAAKLESDSAGARTDARRAKRLLHDAARLVWLGDQLDRPDIANGRPGLQVHFYIIAAESIAKRFTDFQGRGKSQEHVILFFRDVCTTAHRERLGRAFRPENNLLSWEDAIKLLYGVRCDVAHEGQYYNFAMADNPGEGVLWVDIEADDPAKSAVQVYLTADELRKIIVEGAVEAAKKLVPTER